MKLKNVQLTNILKKYCLFIKHRLRQLDKANIGKWHMGTVRIYDLRLLKLQYRDKL